jgi:antitoxin HicB
LTVDNTGSPMRKRVADALDVTSDHLSSTGSNPLRDWRVALPVADRRPGTGPQATEGDRTITRRKSPRIGGLFEDWLKEEGIHEEVTTASVKRVLAWQLRQALKDQDLSKSAMARRMATSRPQLHRLPDPDNASVTLDTLTKAAAAVGRKVRLELVRTAWRHAPRHRTQGLWSRPRSQAARHLQSETTASCSTRDAGHDQCGGRPRARRTRSPRAPGPQGAQTNPIFCGEKWPTRGTTLARSDSATPNQLASVAPNWSTEVVGSSRPWPTSSGPLIATAGGVP